MSGARGDRTIQRVAVIGAGTMGWQIAARTANSGRVVALYDVVDGAVDRALAKMRSELPAAVVGSDHEWDVPALLDRVRAAGSIEDAVADADLVIEAVREHLLTKRTVFAELDRLAPDAILATNSSSLPSATLADAVTRPDRLLNMHFFSPIWQREMLEVMSCGETDQDMMDVALGFGRSLGLITAEVRGQSMGFIINRVWRAVKRESLRVVDEGHATPENIDRLWMGFFGTPAGPFGVMDMVGLDVVSDIEASYVAVTQDPTDRVSPKLGEKVAAGELGEKTGRGFYAYPSPAYREPGFLHETGGPAADRGDD